MKNRKSAQSMNIAKNTVPISDSTIHSIHGPKLRKITTASTFIKSKQVGIAQIEEQIVAMLKTVIIAITNITNALKQNDMEALVSNNKLEANLTLAYYDLLEHVNYLMTAYGLMAKNFRRCIGAVYLSSDILNLIRRTNLIVILATKGNNEIGEFSYIIILLSSVVKKIRHFTDGYKSRNYEQIMKYLQAHTTFRRKWHVQRAALVSLLRKPGSSEQISHIVNILTAIHEIRSMAHIIISMYEKLIYIEQGKIYHLSHNQY